MMNGLPARVEADEERINNHEVRITNVEHESSVLKAKMDLAIQGIYEIRAALLNNNNNNHNKR